MSKNDGSEKNDAERLIKSIKEKTKKGIKLTTDEMNFLVKHAKEIFSEEELKKLEKEFQGIVRMFLQTCRRMKNPKNWRKPK